MKMMKKMMIENLRGEIWMDFLEGLGKLGKAVARETCSYLEYQSRACSKDDVYSDEQRESFAEYSDRMYEMKKKFSDE